METNESNPQACSISEKDILIIDDDSDIRDAITQILEYEGYSVKTASNGKEGIDTVLNSKPGLILLDLMMPVMNGLQFKTELDTHEQLKDIPVVILSADGNIAQKTQDFKISGFLRKPIQLETLLNTVKKHIH